MANSIEDLKRQLNIHDVAARLGLQRPDPNGNYRSPHHADKSPSLQIGGKKYPDGWYDHSAGRGGDVIDLVIYVQGGTTAEALTWLRDQYGLADARPAREDRPATLVEHIAAQSLQDPAPAAEYLAGRGILPEVIAAAIKAKSVGYNAWTSPSKPPGTRGHGGPATAFLVRSPNPGRLVAVDLRYHDPEINGGQKSGCQGEKVGYPWLSDPCAFARAHTVVIVESPINALSAESAFTVGRLTQWATLALRGVPNVEHLDLLPLRGKRVVLCLDKDSPTDQGRRAGQEATWALHLRLTAARIAAHLVDQADWAFGDDLNDVLRTHGAEHTAKALQRFQPWAIPGVSGVVEPGRKRIFLPAADFAIYDHFRVREDFTSLFTRDQDRDGNDTVKFTDLAGFRIAEVAKIDIASATSALTGEDDHQPRTLFAVTTQSPYYGHELIRHVTTFERLHKIDWWQKVGPVWQSQQFLRLINLWGRAVSLGKRDAVNFVGLCWKAGKLHVNEGPDTYFTNPEQQCPYYNLRFPGGTPADGAKVIRAYAKTISHHSALLLLTWALGAHLKAVSGFWPHLTLQGDKNSGKSTLCLRLTRTIACTLFSGNMLETGYRLVTSTSHTSHPVIWEEISAQDQKHIDRAVATLQMAYMSSVSRRGSEQIEYVTCAPVLLMGEAVEEPVRSVIGKSVRAQFRDKGPLLPADLPPFPVRPWLEFLAGVGPEPIRALLKQALEFCRARCRAGDSDKSAERMTANYAAVLTAWRLLQEFAGIPMDEIPLTSALLQEMNSHIADTQASRQPWVWVVEIILNEIAANAYPFPFRFGESDGQEVFFLRPSQMVHHLKTKPGLRALWDGMPVKSDRVLKKQMRDAGVIVADRADPTIFGQRAPHMIALSLAKLAEYGLYPEAPADRKDLNVLADPDADDVSPGAPGGIPAPRPGRVPAL